MNKPEISCVVPAYENLSLLSRCLMSILTQQEIEIEVIVCDDSESNDIREFLELLATKYSNVQYLNGPRSGNPVDNWNKGLKKSTADYCLVIHHDEFLVDNKYLRGAIDRIERNNLDAVVSCSAVVGIARKSRFSIIRRLMYFFGKPLWMLFFMNWVGSTANIVFRKRVDLEFDASLKYLVDVDFYYRIFIRKLSYEFINRIVVISVAHHSAQITAGYDFLTKNIEEIKYLRRSKNFSILSWQYNILLLLANFRKMLGPRR
jgi:glycosyltransferase involved in cell wall biosynthesis